MSGKQIINQIHDLTIDSIYIIEKGFELTKVRLLEITDSSYYFLNMDNNVTQRMYKNHFSKSYRAIEEIIVDKKNIEELKANILELLSKI